MIPADDLPIVDDFIDVARPGLALDRPTTSGHRRAGIDREGVLSIDRGRLRIMPLVEPGWGRAVVRYGPLLPSDGLRCSVVVLNGRNGSDDVDPWPSTLDWAKQAVRGTQSDPPLQRVVRRARFRGRDGLARRLRAARRDGAIGPERRSDLNLAFHWSTGADATDPTAEAGLVVRSTGPDNAELCAVDDGRLRSVLAPLFELPLRLVLRFVDGEVHYQVAVDDGDDTWPELRTLATAPGPAPDRPGWIVLQQRVLGQVGWGMDTWVDQVRIDRPGQASPGDGPGDDGGGPTVPSRIHRPATARATTTDRLRGRGEDLAGRHGPLGAWRHVAGGRPIVTTERGALVTGIEPVGPGRLGPLARLVRPNGHRTMYVVERADAGWVEAEITPPGSGRGEGHGGRAGLVLYQDPDNFLIVNDWLADEYPGASVSAFRRVDGYEEVYDAVWVNVGGLIDWGRPHRLAVGFDDDAFTAHLDGRAVLTRAHRDIYPDHPPLRVRAVGLCANWEFGDDTGSRFGWFSRR